MTTQTPNLGITQVDANQSQKHVTINEALLRLDALIQAAVISASETAPPGTPADGDRYVVATGATGDWAGQDGSLAVRQAGAWLFLAPQAGWRVHDVANGAFLIFDGSAWGPVASDELPEIVAGDAGKRLVVNATEDGVVWEAESAELPAIITGDVGKVLVVNGTEDGVEWGTPSGGGAVYPDLAGNAGNVLAVNASENDVEWVPNAAVSGASILVHVSARYWRLSHLLAGSTTGRSIAEILCKDDGGSTLTPVSASAYSEFSASTSADKAIDSNTGTFWSSNGISGSEYFELDFGTGVHLASIGLTARNDASSNQTPRQFALEHSDDGLVWSPLGYTDAKADFTAGQVQVFDVSPLTEIERFILPDLAGNAGKILTVGAAEDNVAWVSRSIVELVTGPTYATTEADHIGGKYKRVSDATGCTVTVTAGIAGEQPCMFIQAGAGAITFAAGTGVTINSKGGNLTTNGQFAWAKLIPVGADEYDLIGDLTV